MVSVEQKCDVILYAHYVLTHENLIKTADRCSTQLAKMSTDPKLVELTADVVLEKYKIKKRPLGWIPCSNI